MTNSMARWGVRGGMGGTHLLLYLILTLLALLLHTWGVYLAGRKTSSFISSAFCPKSQNLDSFLIYTRLVLINYSKPKGKGKGF